MPLLSILALAGILEVRTGTADNQRVFDYAPVRIQPLGFTVVSPILDAVPTVVCSGGTRLGAFGGYQARCALVGAYPGAFHQRLVVVWAVAIAL